jgi:hypothetical protein
MIERVYIQQDKPLTLTFGADRNPQMHDARDQLTRCIDLLHSDSSDEDKLVALTLIPRILNKDDKESIQVLFNGMNFHFLDRLLVSRKNACDVSQLYESTTRCTLDGKDGTSEANFSVVAIQVFATFSKFDEFINRPVLTSRVGLFSKSLLSQ